MKTNQTYEENGVREPHLSKQFDQTLEWIHAKILFMGGLIENQFRDAYLVFEKGSEQLANEVAGKDLDIDKQELELDHACAQLIIRRQPVANDLRDIMATVKIVADLERMGDETIKIAKSSEIVFHSERRLAEQDAAIITMFHMAQKMIHDVLDIYARMNTVEAVKLIASDSDVDTEFYKITNILVDRMKKDSQTVDEGVNLLRIAKAIERICDHTTNIAEYVIYSVEGKDIRHINKGA